MLTKEQLEKSLSVTDLTLDSSHCIALIMQSIIKELETYYKIPANIERGQKIVSKEDNYKKLGYPETEVTLGTRYTRYVNDQQLLRTQMTSAIPKILESYALNPQGKKLWVCPGLVYRRDVVDRTHVGEPHQMDVWLVDDKKTMNRQDLLNLVETIVGAVGKILKTKLEWRYNETSHHYTDEGIEVEINYKGKWMEILECGLAGRTLLNQSGLSSYSGLALGMGLDRLAMVTKQIEDIRILRDPDERVRKQMKNLEKYKPVSKQPATKRDLSIAVKDSYILEELTEEIMALLGEQKDSVEEISLVSDTPYQNLPEVAKERLGMNPSQKNWLLRIILRHPSRSITNEEANSIYTLIYDKINEGAKGYKIS